MLRTPTNGEILVLKEILQKSKINWKIFYSERYANYTLAVDEQ